MSAEDQIAELEATMHRLLYELSSMCHDLFGQVDRRLRELEGRIDDVERAARR